MAAMSRLLASPTPDGAAAPLPGTWRGTLRHVLLHGAQVAAANAVVAAIVLILHGGRWDVTLVYAQSIGLSCWVLIELGRLALPLDDDGAWPRGWRTPALLVISCATGYAAGRSLADAVFGYSSWPSLLASPRELLGDMAFTAVFSAIVIGWFFARTRSRAHAARLAAARHEATLAHLALLQSQLEPHMLFNTLANLRALIALDPARAQEMLDRLIAFLRATLQASRAGPHALADEFARIEDYLALMQVRMGPRLRVAISLPRELAGAIVPPLLLQPLVENAIKHGLEPRRGPGELEVCASRDGATLVLRIEDGSPQDGAGPGERPLAQRAGAALSAAAPRLPPHLPPHLPSPPPLEPVPEGTGFGLVQVRERLRRLHGDAATLSLAPGRRDGLCAEVRLPLALAAGAVEGRR
jgi:signal transduction histidine kinase